MVIYPKSCFLFKNILVFKDAQVIRKKKKKTNPTPNVCMKWANMILV